MALEKKYPFEAIKKATADLSVAEKIEPKKMLHSEALEYMKPVILDLSRKNYDENQISAMLKERGLKFAVKEIKSLLESEPTT